MNKGNRNIGWICGGLAFIILIVDQWLKIWIKTNMSLGESIHITDWFYINFVENNGMAYGMSFINKYVLSIFRIVAVVAGCWYFFQLLKKNTRKRYFLCLTLVISGALGNIIDSMFYGLFFEASTPWHVADFVSFGAGYSGFLTGKVVDMFYFPLIVTTYPDWIPLVGGQPFIFFSPVFNVADAAISVGMVLLLLLCRRELSAISSKSVS